jgi:hypothetical protein
VEVDNFSSDITIILSTSPMPSHPSTAFVDEVVESIYKFLFRFERTKIIITCDGTNECNESYEHFILNLEEKYKGYEDIEIIKKPEFGHLTGNLRFAIERVETEFVFLVQHDISFLRFVDIAKVIEDMRANPQLKHVRFNKRRNTRKRGDYNLGKKRVDANYKYISTPQWSDQNHICTVDYFKNEILTRVNKGFMEHTMRRKVRGKHGVFGTYLFGDHNDPSATCHLQGRHESEFVIPEFCCIGHWNLEGVEDFDDYYRDKVNF